VLFQLMTVVGGRQGNSQILPMFFIDVSRLASRFPDQVGTGKPSWTPD
jgi:hypothetical protein